MRTRSFEEAEAHLREIVAEMRPGEEVVLTENGQALARLVKAQGSQWPCRAGSAKEQPHWMAPDFNAPLDEFKEYTE